MKLDKLSTLLVVDRIEDCLPTWKSLGYEVTCAPRTKGSSTSSSFPRGSGS